MFHILDNIFYHNLTIAALGGYYGLIKYYAGYQHLKTVKIW